MEIADFQRLPSSSVQVCCPALGTASVRVLRHIDVIVLRSGLGLTVLIEYAPLDLLGSFIRRATISLTCSTPLNAVIKASVIARLENAVASLASLAPLVTG